MSIEKFEVHGGSQDGRMFEFVNPFRPLTFSMDGHERYCLRFDNASFGLVAPDADLVIHKDEKDVRFGTLEVPDDGKIEATEAFSAGSKCISTEDYIADLRAEVTAKDAELTRLRAENDRLRQDRADALSVTSRDGLLSSEWIARTGAAERKARESEAEITRLRAELERVRGQRDRLAVVLDAQIRGAFYHNNDPYAPDETDRRAEASSAATLADHGLRIVSGKVEEIES